jgi:hypothetical protein
MHWVLVRWVLVFSATIMMVSAGSWIFGLVTGGPAESRSVQLTSACAAFAGGMCAQALARRLNA